MPQGPFALLPDATPTPALPLQGGENKGDGEAVDTSPPGQGGGREGGWIARSRNATQSSIFHRYEKCESMPRRGHRY